MIIPNQKQMEIAPVNMNEIVNDGKNEKLSSKIKVKPSAITIRKDNVFTNARSSFPQEPLETLEKSIQNLGLLKQLCIERNPLNKDEFLLIAGERRHICLTNLIKKNSLCKDVETGEMVKAEILYNYIDVKIVTPKDDIERLAIMLAENGEHSAVPDWDYFNFALYLSNQKNPDGTPKYTRNDLCRVFNKSSPWVTHTLQLADLPERAKKCLKDGSLSRTAAIQLLSAKEEQIAFVLDYTESTVLKNARKEIEEAERILQNVEIEVEVAEIEIKHANTIGDRIAAKLGAQKIGEGKKIIRAASDRHERAKKTLEKPVITDESIKQTFAEKPTTLKEGIAPKTRSPKLFRGKLKEIKQLLENAGKNNHMTQNGKEYALRDIRIIIAVYEQLLGHKPMDIFAVLDEEYRTNGNTEALTQL